MSKDKPSAIYLDDEEMNLILFKEMFKRDFDVFTTTYPQEALEYVQNNQVEYVFTDQLMPVMTGVEFLRELHKMGILGDRKKVMISGYAPEGEVNEAIEQKLIDQFIDKPWTYDGLKQRLDSLE